jgi:hypothetical protein
MGNIVATELRHQASDFSRFEAGPGLADLLRSYLSRQDRSYAQVAAGAEIDVAYVFRLCNGRKANPSRDVLIRIAGWGLGLAPHEIDELLLAADYAPLFLSC